MSQTAFLIGATGNVGRSLLAQLQADHAARSLRVRVGVRSPRSVEQVRSLGMDAVPFDLDRPQDFDLALRGADRVFLLRPYTLKQLMHGKLVADAAKRVGVRHVVCVGAFGRPETPWAVIAWNFLVEAYIERLGLGYTHLQPNYFMDNLLAQRDPGSSTIFNRITVPVSWIASSDIAAVAAAVLRRPEAHANKIYPLAAEAASLAQIAAWCGEITGRPHTVGITPREKMMERLTAQGREPEYALALVDYADAVNRGEVPEIADTYDTVEQVTGRPAVRLREFLKHHLSAN